VKPSREAGCLNATLRLPSSVTDATEGRSAGVRLVSHLAFAILAQLRAAGVGTGESLAGRLA